jgi:O-antigen/teichoic acid export membrane protein
VEASIGQVVGRVVSLCLQTACFALLARQLDQSQFVSWISAVALLQLIGAIAEFGLPIGAQIALNGDSSAESHAAIVRSARRVCWTLAVSGALIAILAAPLFEIDIRSIVALLPWFLATRLQTVGVFVRLGLGQWRRVAFGDAIGRLLSLVLLASVSASVESASEALFFGAFVTLLVSWPSRTRRPDSQVMHSAMRSLLRASVAPGLAQSSAMIHGRNDQLILARTVHSAELPAYASGYRVFEAAVAISTAAFGTLLGNLGRLPRLEVHAYYRKKLPQVVAISVGIAGALIILGPIGAAALIGEWNPSASRSASVLGAAAGLAFLNGFVARFAFALGVGPQMARRQALVLLGNLVANLVFIPRGGITVAAATTLIFELVGVLVSLGVVRLAILRQDDAFVRRPDDAWSVAKA